jgi:hypothetical protein
MDPLFYVAAFTRRRGTEAPLCHIGFPNRNREIWQQD